MGKTDLLAIIVKNIGLGVADTLSAGMGSAIKNSFAEIPEQIKKTNDALYYMQVKTFLETADLDQEQVTEFLNINPDNLRLGLEVLKILESTVIQEQAKMLARAFKLYVNQKYTDRSDFDGDVYLIKSMDRYLLSLFIQVANKRNDGVDYTYNSQQLEHLDLVIRHDNPIQNSANQYAYQISQLGKDFYERIVKNL